MEAASLIQVVANRIDVVKMIHARRQVPGRKTCCVPMSVRYAGEAALNFSNLRLHWLPPQTGQPHCM